MEQSKDPLHRDQFTDLAVPPQLEESIARHRVHLAQLIQSMKTAGVSDAQIDESINVLVASYKEELLRTIKSMVR